MPLFGPLKSLLMKSPRVCLETFGRPAKYAVDKENRSLKSQAAHGLPDSASLKNENAYICPVLVLGILTSKVGQTDLVFGL